jgi:hypothetical protein
MLLSTRLWQRGVEHSIIEIRTTTNAVHGVIEAAAGGKHYVLDPTLGIAYRGRFVDVLRAPDKANPVGGAIAPGLSAYAGPTFYRHVAFFLRQIAYSGNHTVPGGLVKVEVTDNAIVVRWPAELDVQYLTLLSATDVKVIADGWSAPMTLDRLVPMSAATPLGRNVMRFRFDGARTVHPGDVRVDAIASRTSLVKATPMSAPLATYFGFEGGHAEIDSIELKGTERRFFRMDVGDLASERGLSMSLITNEAVGRAFGNWGLPVTIAGVSYRPVDARIKSETGHAVVYFAPDMRGLKDERSFRFVVCYRNPEDGTGETRVKVFDLNAKRYEYIGKLEVTEQPTCSNFPVRAEIIAATLGAGRE